AREIRNARESDRIKAVVLRINSPGGSLTGSDIIWREIMLTKEKKPVIASMGDYAASGGYYLSMPCDTIVAQPNTITGSIGIFGMMFNMEKFLENKLGITFDVVKTGEYSDIMTVTRSLSDFEKQIIQDGVNEGYETFTSKAAEARHLPIEKLKELAGGRVWTGVQAHELGLVDLLGSFDDAVKIAANKAELGDDYLLSFYPKQKNFFEEMFSSASNELEARSIKNNYGMLAPYLKEIRNLQHYEGIQARMPYSFDIK
ncbi:MAG: signal peptide peptidase SppA, partial [Imperialibacter sp.]